MAALSPPPGRLQGEVRARNANYATIMRSLKFTPHSWYNVGTWAEGLDERHQSRLDRRQDTGEDEDGDPGPLSPDQVALQQVGRPGARLRAQPAHAATG